MSTDARDLLNKMLQYNPAKRISCLEALNHRYFTSDMSFLSKFNKIVPSRFQISENDEKVIDLHEFISHNNKDHSHHNHSHSHNNHNHNKDYVNEEKCRKKVLYDKYYNRKDKVSYMDYIDKEFLMLKKY